MDHRQERVITSDDIREFRQKLFAYEDATLRLIYEYFRDDLAYILETLNTQAVLSELKSRNFPDTDNYLQMQKVWGAELFSSCLLEDILKLGKEAVIAFLECLYALQNDYSHPNLLAVIGEIIQRGEDLVPVILLDQCGCPLQCPLDAIQESHKDKLLNDTQNLHEHKAPGLSQDGQKFLISERYLDLIVVSGEDFRKRSSHEVIETGGKHEYYLQKAQSKLERITANKLFRWCHRSGCVPRTVMASGVPGVGKTTLMQKFVYDWVTGKHYQRFAFVFFFKFRDLNLCGETSLEEMIHRQYPYLDDHLNHILLDPESLLFIFDGLDESSHDVDFRVLQHITTKQRVTGAVVVASLANQTLLNGCSVLMTSRPTKLAATDIGNFQRVSEVMGFFPKERQKYFEQVFRNKVLSDRAFQYVRENDTLYTFCYIPTYCWIVCTVLSTCFLSETAMSNQPKTITQLFVTYVANILANHAVKNCDAKTFLKSIGWMAEYGIMNRMLTFTKDHCRSFSVDTSSGLLSSFIVESVQHPNDTSSPTPGAVTYSFLHLTIQEFFSALVHFLDYSEGKMKESFKVLEKAEDGRGEIFLRFLCGLSDLSTRSLLKPFLGEFSPGCTRLAIEWLESSAKKVIEKTEKDSDDKRKSMNIFSCLFESRNTTLVRKCVSLNKNFDFTEFHLTPVDCSVLAFILRCCEEVECLDFDTCFMQSEGFQRLSSFLHIAEDLRLAKNDLSDDDVIAVHGILTHCQCRVKKLSLRENGLTFNSCNILAQAIYENHTLVELDLSKNSLTGEGFEDLIQNLSKPGCNISCLRLQQMKIGDNYARCLVSLSANRNLTYLDLSLNYFSDASVEDIRDLILNSNLGVLRINTTDLSREAESCLKQLEAVRDGLKVFI